MIHAIAKYGLRLFQANPCIHISVVQVFLKHRGKRSNCSSQAISPFHTVFSVLLVILSRNIISWKFYLDDKKFIDKDIAINLIFYHDIFLCNRDHN